MKTLTEFEKDANFDEILTQNTKISKEFAKQEEIANKMLEEIQETLNYANMLTKDYQFVNAKEELKLLKGKLNYLLTRY